MNRGLKFLLSFPEIKEKNKLFGLYRGFVNCLNNQEALVLLTDKKIGGLKAEAITKKVINNVSISSNKQNNRLFREAITAIKSLEWPRSQRVAKILFGINPYIGKKEKLQLVRYFLNSKYNSFRHYAYNVLEKDNLKSRFKTELLNVWHKYPDVWILDLLVDLMNRKELFSIYEVAEEVLADAEFDFEVLKLRNRYYSKIIDFIPHRLSELLSKEPVSYVFVMKYANKQIPEDLAVKIYKKERSNSVASCYGELGQWNVLDKLFTTFYKK